jgi:hypothetical protein
MRKAPGFLCPIRSVAGPRYILLVHHRYKHIATTKNKTAKTVKVFKQVVRSTIFSIPLFVQFRLYNRQ